MSAFVIAAVTGVAEAYLLNFLIKGALSGNIKKTAVFLLLKLLVYAAAVSVIMLFFQNYIIKAALGYCLGLPGAVLIFTAVSIFNNKKGGNGENGNGTDN